MNTEPDIKKQLEFIGVGLDAALEHGLELEVIYFALKYMKENSNVTPAEAFALGIAEWIK